MEEHTASHHELRVFYFKRLGSPQGFNDPVRELRWFAQGRTPLHWAAEFNKAKVVDLLLKSGASLQLKSNSGRGPRAIAARCSKYRSAGFNPGLSWEEWGCDTISYIDPIWFDTLGIKVAHAEKDTKKRQGSYSPSIASHSSSGFVALCVRVHHHIVTGVQKSAVQVEKSAGLNLSL